MENISLQRLAETSLGMLTSAHVGVRRNGLWPRQDFPSWEAALPGVGPDQAQAPFCSLKRSLEGKRSLEMRLVLGGP